MRPYTDGFFTVLKAHRDAAMQAGQPIGCTTPKSEVMAQRFEGGIDGATTNWLDFDDESDQKIKTWSGLSLYHVFKFCPNGDIRVWRSCGIGPGKLFKKEQLDKFYVDNTPSEDNKFPHEDTDAKYIPVKAESETTEEECRKA